MMMVFLKLIRVESRSFAMDIVEESISSEEIYAKNELNIKLLQSELSIHEKAEKKQANFIYDNINGSNAENSENGAETQKA